MSTHQTGAATRLLVVFATVVLSAGTITAAGAQTQSPGSTGRSTAGKSGGQTRVVVRPGTNPRTQAGNNNRANNNNNNANNNNGGNQNQNQNNNGGNNNGGLLGNIGGALGGLLGPFSRDFLDINAINPIAPVAVGRNGSVGSAEIQCGTNAEGHFNADNFIAAPGKLNGAEHLHDYVGNLSTDANSTDASLAAAGTTCNNGDKSTYFWPVIRIRNAGVLQNNGQNNGQVNGQNNGGLAPDQPGLRPNQSDQRSNQQTRSRPTAVAPNATTPRATAPRATAGVPTRQNLFGAFNAGQQADVRLAQNNNNNNNNNNRNNNGGNNNNNNGGNNNNNGNNNEVPSIDHNVGQIISPSEAKIEFLGNPVQKVVAMPPFLKILYGDAKVNENGVANARAAWTCSGFEDRLSNKYAVCPPGSKVTRIHDFPSCWDGRNTDSANHRTHIVFPQRNGACPRGFKAVPQLRTTLTYDLPENVVTSGAFAVDGFPSAQHSPFSDHDDFANVMPNALMQQIVSCVNNGQTCR